MGGLEKYEVTANLPGWDGPFVLEVTSSSANLAKARCMYSLMGAGKFDPTGMSPTEALALFEAKVVE